METYVSRAIEEARKSHMTQKHGAVIISNDRKFVTGHNDYNDVSLRKKSSIHAEHRAIKLALQANINLKRCKLVVVRISNHNKLMYSEPCVNCKKLIEKHGVPMVYYSKEDQQD